MLVCVIVIFLPHTQCYWWCYSKLPWKKESRRGGSGSGARRVSFSHCPRIKASHCRRRRYSRCPSRHGSSHELYSTDDEADASHSQLTCGSSDTTPSSINSPHILKEFVNDAHIVPPSWRVKKMIFQKCVDSSDISPTQSLWLRLFFVIIYIHDN